MIAVGSRVLFSYAADDAGLRNLAAVTLPEMGFTGRRVAEALGITEEYVSTLRRREGSAGLVCPRGRPSALRAKDLSLFGLTMDYVVFILSRMREEYDRAGSTTEAVVRGIGRTGRLVSCAALILFFSFASMTTGGELDVAVFASGMALGLLIDATVIRCVLVPATVAMMGRWNWWLPAWAARLLLVPASPVAAEDASAPALGPERRRSETTGARA